MTTRRAMPVLQVRDVATSEAFYARLGFASHGAWGDPPAFCIVQRGDVTLALDLARDGAAAVNQWWAACIYVANAGAVEAEFAAEGVTIAMPLHENEYGLRDFDVTDPDGHRICFGSDIGPAPLGPGLGPDRGRG
ncbi:MAG: VOC family protein [Pseudomonadota bacterium]